MEFSFSPFTSYLITCMALRRLRTLNYIHSVHIPECEMLSNRGFECESIKSGLTFGLRAAMGLV